MTRISRETMYLGMAKLLAQRSTCLRGQVGAMIVVDNRPAGGGYNGAPPGLPECIDVGCEELTLYRPSSMSERLRRMSDADIPVELGCQRAIHAELNAIAWAARHGVPTGGATMYATHSPCKACAQAIVAAGIIKFVYTKSYRAERLDILTDAKIEVIQHA